MNRKIFLPVIIVILLSNLLLIGEVTSYLRSIGYDPIFSIDGKTPFIYTMIACVLGEVLGIFIVVKLIVSDIKAEITKVTEYITKIQDGNYEKVVHDERFDELKDLIWTIDDMALSYKTTTRKLSYEKRKAESILEFLDQGIIMVDDNGIIMEVNNFARNSLKLNFRERERLVNSLSYSPYKKMVDKAIKTHERQDCEVVVDDHTVLHFNIKPLHRKSKKYGYMVSVRDITQIRKFDEMRYQFVSNITHELKTPLTSIKGFVETLLMGAMNEPTTTERFLKIIDIESTRLYSLIEDILLLSEIEQSDEVNDVEFNMTDVVRETTSLLGKQAMQKDILLVVKLDDVIYRGEVHHFKQIFLNLISNAIKYTEEGEINIRMIKTEKEIKISVADTGVGIPFAHLDRIFERFYTVDKSRSRQSGGTGLGLSIVKHLVHLYNGDISVESTLGDKNTPSGTKFTVTFRV